MRGVLIESRAQFILCGFERSPPRGGQIFPGPVDVECQHRHGGPERGSFPSQARARRAFERCRDLLRIIGFEDILFEIEGVALLHDFDRPFVLLLAHRAPPPILLVNVTDGGHVPMSCRRLAR
jgi:hypothetical protein